MRFGCGARRQRDRGSVTIETVIMAPVFGAFVALIIIAGRIHNARLDIDAAASQAARTITLSDGTRGAATTEARDVAEEIVREGGPTCRIMEMDAQNGPPVFEPGQGELETILVQVSCLADLSGMSALPVPGAVWVRSREVIEVFDQHVEEQ